MENVRVVLGETHMATVLVPDLLGFGDSGPPGADCHATGHAAAVLAMLEARGISAISTRTPWGSDLRADQRRTRE